MKNVLAYLTIVLFSGTLYCLIEVSFRGRTHFSMFFAGAICFFLLYLIQSSFKNMPLAFRCILGAVSITSIELIFGSVFNMAFHDAVWDYSYLPYNFLGQICLPFTLCWGALCIIALPLSEKIFNTFLIKTSLH